MLEYFRNLFNKLYKKPEEPNIITAVAYSTTKTRSLQLRGHPPPRSLFALRIIQPPDQINADYKLVVKDQTYLGQITKQKTKEVDENASLLEDMNQLNQSIQQLSISEKKLNKSQSTLPQISSTESKMAILNETIHRRQIQLKRQFKKEIVGYLQCKYSKEKSQYPQISFQNFKIIQEYWKNKNKGHNQIKITRFECVQKLTYKALGGLYYGQWLNDDVINIYIEMLEMKFIRQAITQFKILNSFFATNTLTKTQSQVQRFLKKKSLDKANTLIMPVNNRNHWYFAVFEDGQLVIYDSLKHQVSYYAGNPIFRNAIKFSKMFYQKEHTLVVRQDYPQQDNYYDCGIFMLMGIRDILRGKQWSCRQGDMRFKRIQIAYEILQQTIIYSD